jgi:putative protease
MKNKFGKEIELLAPAGNMDRLKTAVHFGADAIYLGGKEFGLRAGCSNFDEEQLRSAVKYAHENNKKIYVTVNIFAKNSHFPAIKKYAKLLENLNIDAVIISDLGILKIFRETTKLEIHISTQANVNNKYTAMQYAELGAARIILARELPLADIAEICEYLHGKAAAEVFVHGSMCISYSGRCLLSNYLTERESNLGCCAQPCRYKYALCEEKRPNEFYPIEEDDNGTYILNSKDLCLINHLQELADAGVASFKIEGRMKSEYYVGGVVNAYHSRMKNAAEFDYMTELNKTAHRPFTAGFTFGDKTAEFTKSANPIQTYEILGIVLDGAAYSDKNQYILLKQKNKFSLGDEAEILSPDENFNKNFTITKILNEKGEEIESAKTPEQIVKINCPFHLHPNDILRTKTHLN